MLKGERIEMTRSILKKIVGLGLVGLFVFVSFAVAEDNIGPYERIADVNKDGTIDILDLVEVGQAYGSNLTISSEPNKTVVTVLSFDKEPSEVENATVAIFDPELYRVAIDVQYTNSSGIATFELGSDKNYTAIAWYDLAYNYANFTTNSLGESSMLILLGEPSTPPIRSLPSGWIVVTVQNNETGSIVFDYGFVILVHHIEVEPGKGFFSTSMNKGVFVETEPYLGVLVIPPDWQFNEPYSQWGLLHVHWSEGYIGCYGVYSPDENGCANVVLHVNPP